MYLVWEEWCCVLVSRTGMSGLNIMKYVCLNIIIRYHFLNWNIKKNSCLYIINKSKRLLWWSVVKNQSDSSRRHRFHPWSWKMPIVIFVQLLVMFNSVTPWTVACQTLLSSTVSGSLLKFISIELTMLSSYLILCHHFSSCPLSFLASRSFPMNRLLPSGIDASASASVLPMNIQSWVPLELTGLILQSKGL